MTIEVFEIAEPGGESFDGHETYDSITLKWHLKTDGSYKNSVQVVNALIAGRHVAAPGGEFAAGSSYRARTLKATTLDAQRIYWSVTQTFDNQPIDANIEEQQDPTRHDPAAPENDTPTLTIVSQVVQRPSMHDARGTLAINTALDLMDPVPELLFVMRTYRYEFNSTTQTAYDKLEGTTNSANVTIAGQLVAERAGVITEVEISGPHIRQYQAGATPQAKTFYRNSITFEVLDAPLPSTITLLDPKLPAYTAGALPVFAEMKRSDGQPFTYVPHGNMAANKGFHQLILDAPAAWSAADDYAVGDRVSYGGHRYKADIASTSAAPKSPLADPLYWTQYATGTTGVTKVRILQGDVDPTVSDELASQPVDLPHWLNASGQLMTSAEAMQRQYAMFQQTARAADWTVLPMVS